MRIVVVNNFYPPRVGGSSHLSDALARAYAASGHEVLVVTAAYGDAPPVERRDGLTIVRMPAFSLPESRFAVSFDISFATRPSLRRRLWGLLDGFAPDVVHQHGQFFDLTWATGAWARHRGVPTLLSIHTRLENPQAHYHGVFRALDAIMVRPAMRVHRPHLVVMDALMDDYVRARYRGATAGLEYIPVGVDTGWTAGGDRAAGRARLGVADETPLVLSLGHVIPLRDRVALVEALPRVVEHVPDVRLAVVGRVYYDAFERRADELGVRDRVVSVGAVPKSEVPDLLAAADVESHEQGIGFGTATLEAMAAGVPVVAPGRVDNFPTVPLGDREHLYVPRPGDVRGLADALVEALTNPEQAARVGAAGRRVVNERFALGTVVEQHLEVLERLSAARH